MKKLFFALLFVFGIGAAFAQKQGNWDRQDRTISGSWAIVQEGGKWKLQLKDFKTRSAPDLKIYISKLPLSQINENNVTAQGAVLVSPLEKTAGDLVYSIPVASLDGFQTLVIYSLEYKTIWGAGSL